MIKYPDPSGYISKGEEVELSDGIYVVVDIQNEYAILEEKS